MKESEKLSPVEDGVLRAMRALDNQVSKEWQRRGPEEREVQGVLKWEPIQRRVENLTGYVLELFSNETIGLDSLLIMSQSMVKCLQLLVDELGEEGLGEVRTSYCLGAAEKIGRDLLRIQQALESKAGLI